MTKGSIENEIVILLLFRLVLIVFGVPIVLCWWAGVPWYFVIVVVVGLIVWEVELR